jgi:hypothetical protein
MHADSGSPPVPVWRYAVTALLGLAVVVAVVLLVRPFIFTFSEARDDRNYPVIAAGEVDVAPRAVEIVLNDSHGLLGEVVRGERVGLTVIVAPVPGGEDYTAVSAWSPINDCAVEVSGDRLVDCRDVAWTWAGVPLAATDPPLQRFPTEERNGAVVVDFTQPEGGQRG